MSKSVDFAALQDRIISEGLLKQEVFYYAFKIASTLALLAVGIFLLVYVKNFWVQLLNAFYLGFVWLQIGLIGHDIAHHEVFRSEKAIRGWGIFFWNFMIGVSFFHWYHKHNLHHEHPNHVGMDPDIDMPFIFSKIQYERTPRLFQKMLPYQKIYFLPAFFFAYLNIMVSSIGALLRHEGKKLLEISVLILHFALYFWLIFHFLDFGEGVIFLFIHVFTTGMYMGLIFAPNHKGMPIIGSPTEHPSYYQIVTTRNIFGGPVTDFVYGGLNYQIEHHLFPMMPRPNLKKAQKIIREFCAENGLPYEETSFTSSFKQIFRALQAAEQ